MNIFCHLIKVSLNEELVLKDYIALRKSIVIFLYLYITKRFAKQSFECGQINKSHADLNSECKFSTVVYNIHLLILSSLNFMSMILNIQEQHLFGVHVNHGLNWSLWQTQEVLGV